MFRLSIHTNTVHISTPLDVALALESVARQIRKDNRLEGTVTDTNSVVVGHYRTTHEV